MGVAFPHQDRLAQVRTTRENPEYLYCEYQLPGTHQVLSHYTPVAADCPPRMTPGDLHVVSFCSMSL